MARPRTRLDGRNPEPSLTAPASTARSTSATFSDKFIFSDDPNSSSSPSTSATSTSTIKREEKEKPRHSDSGQDSGQEWDGGQELDDGQELDGRQDSGLRWQDYRIGRPTAGYQAVRVHNTNMTACLDRLVPVGLVEPTL